jgi:hypothetical protein
VGPQHQVIELIDQPLVGFAEGGVVELLPVLAQLDGISKQLDQRWNERPHRLPGEFLAREVSAGPRRPVGSESMDNIPVLAQHDAADPVAIFAGALEAVQTHKHEIMKLYNDMSQFCRLLDIQ